MTTLITFLIDFAQYLKMPLKKNQIYPSTIKKVFVSAAAFSLANAILSGDNKKIRKLLQEETEDSELVNCIFGPLGVTPLHLACAKACPESLILLLVREGAKVSVTDKLGRSALHYASALGSNQTVHHLIAFGADVNCHFGVRSTPQPLTFCDSKDTLARDLAHEFNELPLPECWGRTPLHQAVKNGHVSCVNMLLQSGANVNAEDEKGLTPLLLAGAGGMDRYEAIVDLLVFHGADVNKINPDVNSSPLYHAVALGSAHATKILLNAGAELDLPHHPSSTRVETMLHAAASAGSLSVIRLLLQHGATKFINSCNNVGCTPLHKAAYAGSRDCLQVLIESGGDISACSDSGVTVVNIIMSYVPRPINFLTDCLNSRIVANAASINDRSFKVYLDFKILSPSGCTHQMSVVSALAVTSKLLQNPLVEAFVLAKWAKLRFFFLIISLVHFSFVISLSTYIMIWVHKREQLQTLRVVLMFSSSLLLLHAATELVLMGRQRLQQFETWLTIIDTSLSLMITLQPDSSQIPGWIRHVASIVILFAWCGLMSLIGRFPIVGYYALMFSVVLQNVLKVFLTFICLVIGFALSFSVQFPNEPHFMNPWSSLVRTIVMMTGEYDYRDLFSNNNNSNNTENLQEGLFMMITSHIIFLSFVLLASVALMNLMVGLAVSDIQGLQMEGNIRRLQKQADFVSHLERLLTHKVFVKYMTWCVPRVVSGHHIPTTVTIQPSSITDYEILPTPLLETLINVALQNRSKAAPTSKTEPSTSDLSQSIKGQSVLDSGLLNVNVKPCVSITGEKASGVEDITQLKELLLETLTALNNHRALHQQTDSTDGQRPSEDNAISVNAMLRRVSTPRYPLVSQVFNH